MGVLSINYPSSYRVFNKLPLLLLLGCLFLTILWVLFNLNLPPHPFVFASSHQSIYLFILYLTTVFYNSCFIYSRRLGLREFWGLVLWVCNWICWRWSSSPLRLLWWFKDLQVIILFPVFFDHMLTTQVVVFVRIFLSVWWYFSICIVSLCVCVFGRLFGGFGINCQILFSQCWICDPISWEPADICLLLHSVLIALIPTDFNCVLSYTD